MNNARYNRILSFIKFVNNSIEGTKFNKNESEAFKMKIKKSIIGKYIISTLVLMICAISVTSIVYASSHTFNAQMRLRYLNGKDNGVTYSIGKDKKITVSGSVKCLGYNPKDHEGDSSGMLCGVQSTYIYLCESNVLGARKTICGTTAKVSSANEVKKFVCSGTSTTTSKKYMYIYKPLNDGRDISISGKISY